MDLHFASRAANFLRMVAAFPVRKSIVAVVETPKMLVRATLDFDARHALASFCADGNCTRFDSCSDLAAHAI